jgi:hypothetical protein
MSEIFSPARHFAPPIAAWRKNYSITSPGDGEQFEWQVDGSISGFDQI